MSVKFNLFLPMVNMDGIRGLWIYWSNEVKQYVAVDRTGRGTTWCTFFMHM